MNRKLRFYLNRILKYKEETNNIYEGHSTNHILRKIAYCNKKIAIIRDKIENIVIQVYPIVEMKERYESEIKASKRGDIPNLVTRVLVNGFQPDNRFVRFRTDEEGNNISELLTEIFYRLGISISCYREKSIFSDDIYEYFFKLHI